MRLWEPLDAVQREFDRLLGGNWGEGMISAAYPVNIDEDPDHLFIEAELPGFKKEEINLMLENGVLTITAQRQQDQEQEKENGGHKRRFRHLQERRFARVQRSFSLPTSVDESQVDARLEEGVLKITLNKREEVKPRKIEVK
jgi:HSP20 family protein